MQIYEFMVNSKQNNSDGYNDLMAKSLSIYASFYPRFYLLELTLKTRLYNLLKNKLGDDWFTLRLKAEDPLFEEEKKFILRRKPKNFKLKDNGLLVESALGFWVEFFNKRLYKESKGIPILIFENLPAEIKRKEIYQKLNSVKEFRNKLYHSRIPPVSSIEALPFIQELKLHAQDLQALLDWFGELPEAIVDTHDITEKIKTLEKELAKNE
jgi:hypothetical protein